MVNYSAILGVAAIFAAGAAADRFPPVIGANARINHFKFQAQAWKGAADTNRDLAVGWATSAGQERRARRLEGATAVTATNEAAKACDGRVRRARASAAAIQSIVTKEPKRDAQGCPVRELVDPDQLRHAVRPPDPG